MTMTDLGGQFGSQFSSTVAENIFDRVRKWNNPVKNWARFFTFKEQLLTQRWNLSIHANAIRCVGLSLKVAFHFRTLLFGMLLASRQGQYSAADNAFCSEFLRWFVANCPSNNLTDYCSRLGNNGFEESLCTLIPRLKLPIFKCQR